MSQPTFATVCKSSMPHGAKLRRKSGGPIELEKLVMMFRRADPQGKCPDRNILAKHPALLSTEWVVETIELERRRGGTEADPALVAVRKALEDVQSALPRIILTNAAMVDAGVPSFDQEKVDVFIRLSQAIVDALPALPPPNLPNTRVAEWHKAAQMIAVCAMHAWLSAGRREFGISARSPVVLFTKAFLEAAGMHHEAGTIAQAFSRGMVARWAKHPNLKMMLDALTSVSAKSS